jgi:hypothetical protein
MLFKMRMRLIMSALSLILTTASSFAAVAQPPKSHEIYIRSREGKSVSVNQWTIKGALADGRPVVITMNFADAKNTIEICLVVAGKSWGTGRIDGAQLPDVDIRSLRLNQFGPHVEVIFDYDGMKGCDKPGDLHPEVTVDFTAESVKLERDPGHCSR